MKDKVLEMAWPDAIKLEGGKAFSAKAFEDRDLTPDCSCQG